MERDGSPDVTLLLAEIRAGDETAAKALFPLVYAELRAIAGRSFRGRSAGATLQPTALVHEAYLHLSRPRDAVSFSDRAHFFAVASAAIRQILIQHARKRAAAKRGGRLRRVTLDAAAAPGALDGNEIDLIALDEAMTKLAAVDERGARVVQLKFFGGLTTDEIASVLKISKSTVEDDWRLARAWLRREMSRGGKP